MNEIQRAEIYADSFINHYERLKNSFGMNQFSNAPICDPDFIWEHKNFQELIIQHIRIKGYLVYRHQDSDGLNLRLKKECSNKIQ